MKAWIGLAVLSASIAGCSDQQPIETERVGFYNKLEAAYKSKPSRWSRAYALMKESPTGEDWLLTVHGLPDNKAVCDEIVEPYNSDPSLSAMSGTYICVEINETFSFDSTF